MPIDWPSALAVHDRWLRTVVLARVRQFSAVDEVMQEIALAAVRQRAPLADPDKVAPWLYRLAVTQALLYRRTHGRRRKLLGRYAEQVPRDDADLRCDPLTWLLADERRRLVHEAVLRLAPRDREILLLKYTQDWSYQQLAQRLGASVSAVEARLHRARLRLRGALTSLEEVNVR